MNITNYDEAQTYLGTKADRPLPGTKTRLVRLGDNCIAVRQHRTHIVCYYADQPTTIDDGGWQSVSTKRKINQYTPDNFQVWQEDFVWYTTLGEYSRNMRVE